MWRPDTGRIAETVQSAPSVFNSKPWLLGPVLKPIAEDRIELHAKPGVLDLTDRQDAGAQPGTDRRIYADPLAREFAISCGAALYNLRLAIRVAGHDLSVWLLPDRKPGSTLLASVEIVTGRIKPPLVAEQELYEAIWRRHTNRWPYAIVPAPLPIIAVMEDAAAQEGASLRLLHRRQARKWMRFVAEADQDLAGGPDDGSPDMLGRYRLYQQERDSLLPGVPRAAFGPAPEKRLGRDREADRYPRTRRDFWLDDSERRFERNVQLMALSTPDDQLLDWLRAGQALQRAILTGTWFTVTAPYGRTAEYHAPRWYGVPAPGHFLRHDELARYGLSTSFLTEPLECYDIEHPPGLENVHGEPRGWPGRFFQPRHRPWHHAEPRHWPWRWRFAEVPQMVLRVGYAAVPARPEAPDAQPGQAEEPARR